MVVLFLALALAQSINVQPATATRGARVVVTGRAAGCPRGDAVTVLSRAFAGPGFAGVGGAAGPVRAGGAFRIVARVARRAKPGRYAVTARCGGGTLAVRASLRVRR